METLGYSTDAQICMETETKQDSDNGKQKLEYIFYDFLYHNGNIVYLLYYTVNVM